MNMKHAFNEKELSLLRIFAYLGLFFGIGADIIWIIWPFNGLPPHTANIKIATLLVQTISALLFTLCFAWIYIKLKVNVWLSVPVGAILGAIATAITFGLASGTYMAIGIPANAIIINQPEVNSLPGLQLFLHMFMNGAKFGALIGLLPGAIAGAILSLNLGSKDQD